MSVLAGLSGGLVGVLWSGLVSSPWLAGAAAEHPSGWHVESIPRLAAGALLRAVSGAALGFLFWLGWGLIAVLRAPWPLVGVLFGLLCWAGAALPALATLGLRVQLPRRSIRVHAIDWLVSCVVVGLLCAYAWYRLA
ncbi:MAG TPA: hypothetical protein VLM41_02290 [Steroidobacteraceae bacterium]|nr:hypothetical protein [Steroidobacteraceae bacterium]